jgi:hypothetical protein
LLNKCIAYHSPWYFKNNCHEQTDVHMSWQDYFSIFPVQEIEIQWNLSKSNIFGTNFCVLKTGFWFIQVTEANILYIGTLFKVCFIQDSGLFRVWFRQVYTWFWFRQVYTKDVWFRQISLYFYFLHRKYRKVVLSTHMYICLFMTIVLFYLYL